VTLVLLVVIALVFGVGSGVLYLVSEGSRISARVVPRASGLKSHRRRIG
jgi:hypothetical protein